MKFEMDGFDELEKKLNKIQKQAKELESKNSIEFSELFATSFMNKYTGFNSIENMIESSSFEVESQEDFEAIPEKEWDEFVNEKTRFKTWKQMMEKAAEDYLGKKFDF
jgi:hypothetical protein